MKKLLIALLVVVIAVGAGLGIFFGVKTAKQNETVVKVELIENEYKNSETLYFRVIVFSDTEMNNLSCNILGNENNATGVKTGESKDHEDYVTGGKFYLDTGVQEVSLENLEEGYYVISFYGWDAEGEKIDLPCNPYIFKIVG